MTGLRLALSMFTVFPTHRRVPVTPRSMSAAVRWLPVVGLLVGLVSVSPALLVWHGHDRGPATVAAVLAIGAQALLTRGLHLDGLADFADGLGSGRPAAEALAVMRRSDIGPFGVVTLLGCLLLQVTSLAALLDRSSVPSGLVLVATAAVTGRLAVVWAAGHTTPAARPDGFGALVVGTQQVGAQLALTASALTLAIAAALAAGASGRDCGWLVVSVGAALGAAWGLRRHAARRLGGVTGDVFGALVEVAATVVLVVLAAEAAW